MMQSIENKVLSRIYGNGRGWAFSPKDFSDLGGRGSVDTALSRLLGKGTIRRVMRGIYDYPRYSSLLKEPAGPDMAQVAGALARKFGWRIQPNGPTALNILGLSTQVPGRFVFLSDGPNRSYKAGKISLMFEMTPLKESGFKLPESSLLVQALKSLGQIHITEKVITAMRNWLNPDLRSRVLKDTHGATDWVYESIKKICREDSRG